MNGPRLLCVGCSAETSMYKPVCDACVRLMGYEPSSDADLARIEGEAKRRLARNACVYCGADEGVACYSTCKFLQQKIVRFVIPEKPGSGIKGTFDGPEPKDESEHFEVCPVCGQAIDLRELDQVIHHGQPEHQPIGRDA